MAFDSGQGRVVMLGGLAAGTPMNDTWEWDGQNWTQFADIGPSARAEHAMAYDINRKCVVMFGGYRLTGTTSTYLNDTWEWDGKEWTQVEDTGPAPRSGMAMCFDSKRGRVLLFGGGNATAQFDDTWSWDGISWTQEQDTGPTARSRHGMDYDSARDRMVLFGGMSGTTKLISVWVSDRSFWNPGAGHYENQTVTTSQYFNDTWEYDASVWTRVADTGPAARHSFGFAYGGKVVSLFGGMDGNNALRDTWQWNGAHWTQRQDMGPAPRAPAGAAYDSTRGRMVVFGGAGAGGAIFGDTWEAFERP
jgi:hypothetical protein